MMAARAHTSLLCLLVVWHLSVAEEPVVKVSLKYDESSGRFSLGSEESEPDGLGQAKLTARADISNEINETGWAYLMVETYGDVPDYIQAYGAGIVEGIASTDLVSMHWTNVLAGYCPKPYSKFCAKLSIFLEQNLKWMKEQIKADKARSVRSPFWHQVELFLYQAAGLSDGVTRKLNKRPNTDIDPMGLYLFQVQGDLEALESALGDGDIRRLVGTGSCSALVKLLPGNRDLYVAQDTWTGYESMLRILKVYKFPWKTLANGTATIPGRVQAFSSYPGRLMSGDDYYLLSSGLVSMETTIGNSNPALWKYVTPNTVLEGIRTVVANHLAKSGYEWATTFYSGFNSGTYNNEWMIVDYKRFQPGMQTLPPGVLTVLDQIPGTIKFADLTDLLVKQGYFPSYNVAYFPDIFNASGGQANVKKYGDWFTYDKTPRALIFKRDHVKVKDLDSMTKLMRYNDYTHDPLSRCNCTPPYSGENAISARSDLNPASGTYPFGALGHRLHGGVDMKLTSSEMFKDLTFIAVGGPSWDQQPVFQWSRSIFNATSHLGQPDLWKFSPFPFNWTAIFNGH